MTDFFQVFGLQRRLAVDTAALQRRFYELSRQWHPDFHQARPPARFSKTPSSLHRPAPCFAEHTDEVLAEVLGLSGGDIAALHTGRCVIRSRGWST